MTDCDFVILKWMFKLYSFKSVNDRRENKGEISLVCKIIKKNTVDINAKLLIWNWGYVNGYEWEKNIYQRSRN